MKTKTKQKMVPHFFGKPNKHWSEITNHIIPLLGLDPRWRGVGERHVYLALGEKLWVSSFSDCESAYEFAKVAKRKSLQNHNVKN